MIAPPLVLVPMLAVLAAAPACQGLDGKPEISIILDAPDTRLDQSRPISQLQSAERGRRGTYNSRWLTDGLLRAGIQSRLQVETSIVGARDRPGDVCIDPTRITVQVVRDAEVLIAREVTPGSCRHGVVYEHEMEHDSIDRALLDRLLPALKSQIASEAQRIGVIGPVRQADADAQMQKLSDRLGAALQRRMTQFWSEREHAQGRIDTKANYRKLSMKCQK